MKLVLYLCLALIPTTACLATVYAQWMRKRALGQSIREHGPPGHASKRGTPTMGGAVLLVLWVGAVGILWTLSPPTKTAGFILSSGILFGVVGMADDVISIRRRRSLGLSVLQKILLSSFVAVALFFAFQSVFRGPVEIPFSTLSLTLPRVASFFLTWIVFLAVTNGMNLADGLDGLAAGLAILILIGSLALAPSQENGRLILPLLAVLVGFLWVNAYPAKLFLGDVGSFGLGGIIASVALANGLAFLLPLLAAVLVLEIGSDILQVSFFRWRGKRLFKMSPLHHHFEAMRGREVAHILPAPEWPENRVTIRFCIIQAIFVIVAILAG